MDPITVATSVVAALSPYLLKAADKLAESAGEAALAKTAELYKAVKARFAGSPEAAQQLADLEKDPQDADNQGAVRKILKKAMSDDAAFLQQLAGLLEQAGTHNEVHFHNQIGEVGTLTQIGSAQTVHIGSGSGGGPKP